MAGYVKSSSRKRKPGRLIQLSSPGLTRLQMNLLFRVVVFPFYAVVITFKVSTPTVVLYLVFLG